MNKKKQKKASSLALNRETVRQLNDPELTAAIAGCASGAIFTYHWSVR